MGVLTAPYAASIYHLEVGGRALDRALRPVFPDRLAPEQIVDGPQLETAVEHLETAIRHDPTSTQPRRLLARAYLSLGEEEKALVALQQVVKERPDNPLFHLELADVYDVMGQVSQAIREYERGRIGSRVEPLVANYLKEAEALVEQNNEHVAIELWNDVLDLDPNNLYALVRLAEAYARLEDEGQFRAYEKQLVDFAPGDAKIPLDFRLAAYQGRAMVELVEGGYWDREKALEVVESELSEVEGEVSVLMARRVLETMLDSWPDDGEVQELLETL